MCGIVGYVGGNEAPPIIIEGLRRLEYRGYDSAGVAILDGHSLQIRKKKGRIHEGTFNGCCKAEWSRRSLALPN